MTRKLNIKDLSTYSIPVLLLSSVIIIVGIVFLTKHFFIEDIEIEMDQKNRQISTQEKQYTTNLITVKKLPQIQREVEQLLIALNKAKEFLPTEISMPSLIDSVYQSARNNGIVFDTFTPGKDINSKYYTIKPISLSAKIGYISMAGFVEEVISLKRIMNIHSISFSANNKGFPNSPDRPLNMTAQLRTYVFKNSGKKP